MPEVRHVTLTGTLPRASTNPATGWVQIGVRSTVQAPGADEVIVRQADSIQLEDGSFSTSVPVSHDPNLAGVALIELQILLDGTPPESWLFEVDTAAESIDLADVVVLPTPEPGLVPVVPWSAVGAPSGVAPLNEAKEVPAEFLPPADGGGAAVAAHEAAADPHPQYTTDTDLAAALAGKETTGAAAAAVFAHEAASDPHPGYLTPAEGNVAYDAAGAAITSVTAHTAASNPHGQYATTAALTTGLAGKEPAGAAVAAVAAHEAAADPHPQYTTATEVDERVELIVGAAPAALDTLTELAAALGDDPNFAGTVATSLAGKVSKGGDTIAGPVLLASTFDGGTDTFDSTSRLTIQSWQTNGNHFFGEGIRLDLMHDISKNMIAWRLPRPPLTGDPSTLRSVVWAGAHYTAQDGASIHGHWSIEVPDASDALRTRLEIKFVDQAGAVGLDKTLIQTASADLVVDASNNQVLRLRSGVGAEKAIEFGNDQWGAAPRWKLLQNGASEAGGNAGSDLEIRRFSDAGSGAGSPLRITRSSGRVIVGDIDGSQSGLDVNRNSTGIAVQATTTAVGATAYALKAADTTSRLAQALLTPDTVARVVIFADGKFEWGTGATTRDTNLYRSAADTLKTDDSLVVAGSLTAVGLPVFPGIFVRKTADQFVNANAVLQNDTELAVGVAASSVYQVECDVIYDSATAGDIQFAWTGPAGATLDWTTYGLVSSAAGGSASLTASRATLGSGSPLPAGGAGVGTKLFARIKGLLVTSTTPGTLQLIWAQNTSDATNTTVRTNSYLKLIKVA